MNCLENKKITVKHIFKETSRFLDKKHVLYGGMMDGAFKIYSLPKKSSGEYVNPLTREEEDFLEEYMNLDKGALSVHRRQDNYWDKVKIRLPKEDTYFDMSNPNDFIKVKVLLANTDFICPSLKELERYHKVTYEYVIVEDGEKDKADKAKLTTTMEAYKLLGKIEDDTYKLRIVLEMLEQREVSEYTTNEALLNRINDYITSSPKKFIDTVKDEYLNSKILLRKCIDINVVKIRGNLLYLAEDGSPLCDKGNPTIDVASEYINLPNQADLKFKLEAYVKQSTKYGANNVVATPDPIPEITEEETKKKTKK